MANISYLHWRDNNQYGSHFGKVIVSNMEHPLLYIQAAQNFLKSPILINPMNEPQLWFVESNMLKNVCPIDQISQDSITRRDDELSDVSFICSLFGCSEVFVGIGSVSKRGIRLAQRITKKRLGSISNPPRSCCNRIVEDSFMLLEVHSFHSHNSQSLADLLDWNHEFEQAVQISVK